MPVLEMQAFGDNGSTMEFSQLIPAYQPLPFPLPVWLMQTLLVLGFYLHVLPMNVVWGGTVIAAVLFTLGRRDHSSYSFKTARALAISLPLFISFAITQGIVPLLFLQLLYGPAFYTSSIVMAVPWIGVLAILLISYYAAYLVIYKVLNGNLSGAAAMKAALGMLFMSIGFGLIGYVFSNNLTLMQSPEKWFSLYQSSPQGLNLNLSERQILPRYLHFFIASIAVTGMTVGCFGLYLRKRNQDFSLWSIKLGSRIFLVATVLQIPVGLWFLQSLPRQFMSAFMGGDSLITGVFMTSMVLMLVALLATTVSSTSGNKAAFIAGLVANAVLILAMIINRHQLRLLYLNPHVKPDLVAVSTQWDLLAIFLVSAVALIFYLVWLCRLVWSAYHPPVISQTGSTVNTVGSA